MKYVESEWSGSCNNFAYVYRTYTSDIWYNPWARFWKQRNETWNSEKGRISGINERQRAFERNLRSELKSRNVKDGVKYRDKRLNYEHRILVSVILRMPIPVASRSKVSAAACLLGLRVRILSGACLLFVVR